MGVAEYRFGAFRLLPSTRELWKGDALVHLPRRGFDCLAYLIEHRDRAVGRDELVAVLWGRVDATDSQVNQVVLRARLAVDDDGQAQHAIRTVPGFGYRWIVPLEEAGADDAPAAAAPPLLAASATDVAVAANDAETPVAALPASASKRRFSTWQAVAALGVLVALAAFAYALRQRPPSAPPVGGNGLALAVLPFEVNAPRESSWVRLGAMDLVADRLRGAGLPVPPSDSVVSALHAVGEPLDAARLGRLQHTLGAQALVRGTATRSAGGWVVELDTQAADGTRHRLRAEHADAAVAARQAADLLAAALGRTQPPGAAESDDLQSLLQQAQAALLANQFDTARAILDAAPESLRGEPLLRAKRTQVDYRAGRLDEARTALDTLIADPALERQPRALAQALTTRGFIDIRREDCAAAETFFDSALGAARDVTASRERDVALAARGLARACQRHFEPAMSDLGKARSQLEAAGDRMGVARVDNYLGILEARRDRLAEAVPYFVAAADIQEAFGAIEALRANLTALFITQTHLLRWQDALATSDRLWALRGRLQDPELRLGVDLARAQALMAFGRWREADALLAAAEREAADHAANPSIRHLHALRAELAATQGQPAQTLDAVAKALALWPEAGNENDAEGRARLVLLRQRAAIEEGHPAAAPSTPPAGDRDTAAPARLVAQAEWAAHERRTADADAAFHAALSAAESRGVPDAIAMTAQAYAGWLLAQGRVEDASALSGRVAPWAGNDFDCALLQARVFRAAGQTEAWLRSLQRVQAMAGERPIPPDVRQTAV